METSFKPASTSFSNFVGPTAEEINESLSTEDKDFLKDLLKTATTGIVSKITTVKTGTAADVLAVCGRRPLLNLGGKRDAYDQCAQSYASSLTKPAASSQTSSGLSGLAITGIVVGSLAFIGGIIAIIKFSGKTAKA
jgi:hypothetical protein